MPGEGISPPKGERIKVPFTAHHSSALGISGMGKSDRTTYKCTISNRHNPIMGEHFSGKIKYGLNNFHMKRSNPLMLRRVQLSDLKRGLILDFGLAFVGGCFSVLWCGNASKHSCENINRLTEADILTPPPKTPDRRQPHGGRPNFSRKANTVLIKFFCQPPSSTRDETRPLGRCSNILGAIL